MGPRTTTRRNTVLAGAAASLAAGIRPGRAQANPIRIGVPTDMAGPYRETGGPGAIVTISQAIEDSKLAERGIAVEIVVGDHQNKPDVGLSIARQWFDRDGVDAIAEVNNSAIALAMNDLATAKNKVHICTGAASADLTRARCSPNMVQWQTVRHEQFGASSKRSRKLLDQLELQLEELEAAAAEDATRADPTGDQAAAGRITRRKPVRAPLPAHLPRERVVIPAPTACPCCGGKLAGGARWNLEAELG